ncbi:Hypothetical predicted protein [Podarcis lilfordi]|uniref:Uncharacterized protein n=1 Tax=Podarcis lilfordi TaxID=74358 RepID=A0AA35QPV9_9SAUR|nr:Hypothetical predicted protein [Podarcis lilfordi]
MREKPQKESSAFHHLFWKPEHLPEVQQLNWREAVPAEPCLILRPSGQPSAFPCVRGPFLAPDEFYLLLGGTGVSPDWAGDCGMRQARLPIGWEGEEAAASADPAVERQLGPKRAEVAREMRPILPPACVSAGRLP